MRSHVSFGIGKAVARGRSEGFRGGKVNGSVCSGAGAWGLASVAALAASMLCERRPCSTSNSAGVVLSTWQRAARRAVFSDAGSAFTIRPSCASDRSMPCSSKRFRNARVVRTSRSAITTRRRQSSRGASWFTCYGALVPMSLICWRTRLRAVSR